VGRRVPSFADYADCFAEAGRTDTSRRRPVAAVADLRHH
jgi:hypothetical protein